MTARRILVALLARVFPGRGRHRQQPPSGDDTVIFPKIPSDLDEIPPSMMTVFDVPPTRARRYMQTGSDDGDEGDEGDPPEKRFLP